MALFVSVLIGIFLLTFIKVTFRWECTTCKATYEGNLYGLLVTRCKHPKGKS